MSDNGRKPNSKQQCDCDNDQHPWWHSGSHCLAALLWCFTLAVAWHCTFDPDKWTGASAVLLGVSLVLAVLQSSMASVRGKRQ